MTFIRFFIFIDNQAEFKIPDLNGRLFFAAVASTAIRPTSHACCTHESNIESKENIPSMSNQVNESKENLELGTETKTKT